MADYSKLVKTTLAGQIAQKLSIDKNNNTGSSSKISGSVWNDFVKSIGTGKTISENGSISIVSAMNSITTYLFRIAQKTGSKVNELAKQWLADWNNKQEEDVDQVSDGQQESVVNKDTETTSDQVNEPYTNPSPDTPAEQSDSESQIELQTTAQPAVVNTPKSQTAAASTVSLTNQPVSKKHVSTDDTPVDDNQNVESFRITTNTIFNEKGELVSDKIEESIVINVGGKDVQVKLSIDKALCPNKNFYDSLIKQIQDSVELLSDEAKKDLAREVNDIQIKRGYKGSNTGFYSNETDTIILNAIADDSYSTITTTPRIAAFALSHELGHAVDQKSIEYRSASEVSIQDLISSLQNDKNINLNNFKYSEKYFLNSPEEFFAEYYSYKHGMKDEPHLRLMRYLEESKNEKFMECAKKCEKVLNDVRIEENKIPKEDRDVQVSLDRIYNFNKLRANSDGQPYKYRMNFYHVSEFLGPDENGEDLSNTAILQKFYLYKIGKCDEETSKKFNELSNSKDENWKTVESLMLAELSRLKISV